MSSTRPPYPSDVSDDEWALVAPYLTLLAEDVGQRNYALREVFKGLRYGVKTGAHWRMLPHALPPWPVVYQQRLRWEAAGCFAAIVHDRRLLLRRAEGRDGRPSAASLESRPVQATPESGAAAGDAGYKRRTGRTGPAALDPLGHLLALVVPPAHEQDRTQVEPLAAALQDATGEHVEVAYVDQTDTGQTPAAAAAAHGLELVVVTRPEAKRGFVLVPRRWVVARDVAWASRVRRLARDDARLDQTLARLHDVAFACLMLQRYADSTSRP